MTSDDRDDIEPHSPSSFKVGEVDRLSGFFTPVWESKRRLRAESPIPASSAAASAPSSARGADSDAAADSGAAAERPSAPPAARQVTPVPPRPFVAATPPRAVHPPLEKRPSASPSAARPEPGSPLPAAGAAAPATKVGAPRAEKKPVASAKSPPPKVIVKATDEEPLPTLGRQEQPKLVQPAELAPRPSAAPESEGESSRDGSGQGGVTVRPVIPMPLNPGRTPPRAKAPSVPPAASSSPARRPALEPAAPREPELRPAPPTSAPPARASWPSTEQRAARAAGAAAVLHDKLRSKGVDSVDTFARHRETESEREALQRAAARAAATPPDPYPSHLLRTLRRTLHLSMTLPESVRAMIEKYRY